MVRRCIVANGIEINGGRYILCQLTIYISECRNSVAWRIWALKHIFYLVHYAFIAALVVLQVFPIMKISDLQFLPYTIIVTSLFFFLLEFRQFLSNPRLYIK